MGYFLETADTISADEGFAQFGWLHLLWLMFTFAVIMCFCLIYRRSGEKGRSGLRWTVTGLLLADEVFKHAMLVLGGHWTVDYLPLHLCSINIFLITFYTLRPSKWLGNYLYMVCIPAAVAALLCPTWTSLPFGNFMHLHSFTVHILLTAYPIMLMYGSEVKREKRQIPKCLLLLVVMAALIYPVNLLLDTNFMFLMYAPGGNPLVWFESTFGNHLVGYPVMITLLILLMYIPLPKKKATADCEEIK